MLIVFLYVDDMIYTWNLELVDFKYAIKREFEMTDIGLMKFILGIEVEKIEKKEFSYAKRSMP